MSEFPPDPSHPDPGLHPSPFPCRSRDRRRFPTQRRDLRCLPLPGTVNRPLP